MQHSYSQVNVKSEKEKERKEELWNEDHGVAITQMK
jgi:hypothetical protein